MSRNTKFLLMASGGILAFALGVAILPLLPMYLMDPSRASLRWLRLHENQQALRLCAENLLRDYPEGSPAVGEGGVPSQRVPDLVRRIPPPAGGWYIVVSPAVAANRHVELFSLGGFGSYILYVGNTNFVMEGVRKIGPGIYLQSS